jgi:two-component system cell cycle response regulator
MSKILIAEDDRITARILHKHLTDWGFQVFLEKNGEDAWSTLDTQDIQMALLDWMMPKLNGLELCRKIRQQKSDPYTYLILLTARTATEDIVEGLNSGADDYITKPVDPAELKARLLTGKRIIELENRNKKLQKRLEKLAHEDSLTGFLNKKNIHLRLEEELSRGNRENQPVSALLLDIDKFKEINDTHGHQVGDQVLREISRRLRLAIRKHDQIGRFGGDEILVLLWHTDSDSLQIVADRLCACVSGEPIPTDAGPLGVSVSVGGASSDDHFEVSADTLLQLSDKALYSAKHKGRNRAEILQIPEKEEQHA